MGSGVMGSRIALHFANIGCKVYLLDIPPKELNEKEKQKGLSLESPAVRNRIVNENFSNILKAKPSPVFNKKVSSLVTTGNFDDNMNKVLNELQGVENRTACFRTVISLIIDGEERQFQGMVNGIILAEKKGEKGFGYDPIFQADGFDIAFAEMSLEEKNKISHRAIAVKKLNEYLFSVYPQ